MMELGDYHRVLQGFPQPGPQEAPHEPEARAGGSPAADSPAANSVSAINKCLTKNTNKLLIYDISQKLTHPEVYDIGGTYTNESGPEMIPETWFFFSTSVLPGDKLTCLLNLFVCHRRTGNISIGVSNGSELTHNGKTDKKGQAWLPDTLTWHMFRTAQPDENYLIRSYCFSAADVKALELSTLVIPISIELNSLTSLNNEVIRSIKLSHDFGELLSKQDKADFMLISASQKQFPVHKMFLTAHSAVLRELIKSKSSETQAFVDISDSDMELLLEFIYTGTIKDIVNKDCVKLLQIADKFKLDNLFFLTQFALGDQINLENAVEIACISEHYKLEKLQNIVFLFIKNNPKVLETEGWKNLDDVNLAKKLFQFMHTKRD